MHFLNHITKSNFHRGWTAIFFIGVSAIINSCQFKDLSSIDSSKVNLIQYVNPLIGTNSNPDNFSGNVSPIAAMPFGMNLWIPNTVNRDPRWIYSYESNRIKGFRCSHQPSPMLGDYGTFSIMPMSGELIIDPYRRASEFDHNDEIATPYSYGVILKRSNIKVDVVPTLRGGSFNFTFQEASSSYILLDAMNDESYIRIIPQQNRIVGFCKNNSGGVPKNFANYFIMEFDKPFVSYTLWNKDSLNSNKKEIKGTGVGVAVKFLTNRNEKVNLKIATSFISIPQAITNFNSELAEYSFDELKIQANQAWNNELNKIVVEGGTSDQKSLFYTSFYRALLFPKIFYEFDESGKIIHYSPFDGRVHNSFLYTDIGFWNSHRTLFPFFTLMYPEMNSNILKGMTNAYREGGWLPQHPSPGYRKPYLGNHAGAIFVDAVTKGITDFDTDLAYQAIKKDAIVTPPKYAPGRSGLKEYNNIGYVPFPEYQYSVTKTLEYAYDDYCIWKLGDALGRIDEIESYISHAYNYQNLYDSSNRFLIGRSAEGAFDKNFEAKEWGGAYYIGNAWHYNWNVPHDIAGLINLYGGEEEFGKKLDSLFLVPPEFKVGTYRHVIPEMTNMVVTDLGQYSHINPNLQHVAYLYNYIGKPWRTQEILNVFTQKLYRPTPGGLSGDEYVSNLSSWYLFTAMGFYPITAGTNEYVLGAPIFEKVILNLENGKTFTIEAPNRTSDNFYVEDVELNGSELNQNYILHSDVINGGKLKFEMDKNPNKKFGRDESAYPFSLSKFNSLVKQ